jgi:membrane protein
MLPGGAARQDGVAGTGMAEEEAPGGDWRSVSTRAGDHLSLGLARERAREPNRGREAEAPSAIPGPGWRDIAWRVFWSVPQDRVIATAGGVAFFALLATFPGLATVVSLYGLFSDPTVIGRHLTLLSGFLPAGVLDLLGEQLVHVAGQSSGKLSWASLVSLLIAFWSANSGVSALFDALNVIYKEREARSLVRFYGTTLLFTLSAVAFILVALAAIVVLPIVLARLGLDAVSEVALRAARWPILLALVSLGLSLIFRYGPSRRAAKWRWVSWGSAAAAFLWVCASAAFSWYVVSFDSYNRIYGSLGAGVAFMTWMWVSIVIVLLGAELNAEMERQTARDTTEGAPRPLGARQAFAADTVGRASERGP